MSLPPTAKAPLLSVTDLHKSYGSVQAVNGVSFAVGLGEIVGLLGPNGAGKTTSFYMVSGLIRPDSGQIHFAGNDISNYPVHRRAQLGLGYLSQDPSVFRRLTVAENISVALEQQPLSRDERTAKLQELLALKQLTDIRDRLGQTLSGGQRRRTEIARLLAGNPKILLMDEPFAGVDPVAVEALKNNIQQMRSDGLGILITDHSARDMLEICDRTYVIHEGQVIASGKSADIMKNNEVKERYLGQNFHL